MFNKRKWLQENKLGIIVGVIGCASLGIVVIVLAASTFVVRQDVQASEIAKHQKILEELADICPSQEAGSTKMMSDITLLKEKRGKYDELKEFAAQTPVAYSADFATFQEDFKHRAWCGEYITAVLEAQEMKDRHEKLIESIDVFLAKQIPEQPISTTSPAANSQVIPPNAQTAQSVADQK